jgi:hypothetical protein
MSPQVGERVERSHASRLNIVVVALLIAIEATQVLILLRLPDTPPSFAALRSAKTDDARTKLWQSIPLVRVDGGTVDAEITGTVDVDVQNTPLVRIDGGTIDAEITGTVDVDVQNTPLEVEIVR